MIRLLIAEYTATFTQGFAAAISENPWIEIVGIAQTGSEAVDLARCFQPDVILMNDELPILNGFQATRIIMQDGFVPVIIMSADVDNRNKFIQVLAAKGVDLIGKPDIQNDSEMKTWIDLLVDKICSLHTARCLLNRLRRDAEYAVFEAA
jgi:two-component system, chemotaxis family, protein-glutamate methylesterase/glutaminase